MAFSAAERRRAEQIAARYPHSKSATLPLLHLVQDRDGWVTPQGIEDVAEFLGLTPALVLGTCSFYTMFKLAPVGRLVVSVCTNIACLVNGGPELSRAPAPPLRGQRRRVRRGGRVPRGVRPRAGAAGQLRVPRPAHRRRPRSTSIERYRSGELTARTISGHAREADD